MTEWLHTRNLPGYMFVRDANYSTSGDQPIYPLFSVRLILWGQCPHVGGSLAQIDLHLLNDSKRTPT